jgi:HAD superfamily hydrolase (TIGR01456 family)
MTATANFGVVFDIDGVLSKIGCALPGAKDALTLLKANHVPHMFATNFGGTAETVKAEKMSEQLDVCINPDQLLLSHSPMRQLLPLYQNKLVLVVGRSKALTDVIMQSYGFEKWVWFEDFIATHPAILPMWEKRNLDVLYPYEGQPVAAVFYMHEPERGMDAVQLICDMLLSDGVVSNLGYTRAPEQVVEIYFANPDLTYSAQFNQPRLTVGSFAQCIATFYKQYCNRELRYTLFGKPNKAYFEAAEAKLREQAPNIKTLYMIGDNATSDIRGANGAGEHWHSVLVRTGVFRGGANDETDPAKYVAANVWEAVQYVLAREGVVK